MEPFSITEYSSGHCRDLGVGADLPVVKQAEGRVFVGLARAIADLAARARTKKLLPDEASGPRLR